MKHEILFNRGLSVFNPVSLFIELDANGDVDYNFEPIILSLYRLITDTDTSEVVFHGNLTDNIVPLHWLTPRLLANGYVVGYATGIRNLKQLHDLPTNYIITKVKLEDFKHQWTREIVGGMTNNDMIICDGFLRDTIGALKMLNTTVPTKARLGFWSVPSYELEILNNKIFYAKEVDFDALKIQT